MIGAFEALHLSAAPMQVTILPSGSMLIDHGQLLWNVAPGRAIRHPVYAVLIEHPDGRVLVDSGYELGHLTAVLPFVEPRFDCGGPIIDGLGGRGLGFADVSYLIHTHLHFDHVGSDGLLRGATVFVHKDEMRHAKVPERFEQISYSDQQFDNPDVRLELLEGDTEVLPGVYVLETAGHSAGHYSVLLRGTSGRELLFCGDAAYSAKNLEQTIISGFHLDAVESVRSLRRLQRLAVRETVTLFFPHDMEAFRGYRVSPHCYEI
jgi:4-pyridoxolactonase